MLTFESYFASLPMNDVSINIWIDASPQWRSRVLLASSLDLVIAPKAAVHKKVKRKQFPVLRIAIGLHTAFGKCVALLGQIWLLMGPKLALSRDFLRNVVSTTTDTSAKRLLTDLPDLLPAFFKHIGAALPQEVEFGQRLFPHCMSSLICDGPIQTGLNS